MTVASHDGRFK